MIVKVMTDGLVTTEAFHKDTCKQAIVGLTVYVVAMSADLEHVIDPDGVPGVAAVSKLAKDNPV